MVSDEIVGRALSGAAAGAVATLAMHPLREATAARFPDTRPPMADEPGAFMVKHARRALPDRVQQRIPRSVDQAAAKSLALGYGVTFGVLYGLARRKPGNLLLDGAALGLVAWAAGYLGWLPAAGLMPPVTRQKAKQVVTPIAEHVFYGIVAAAVVRACAP